MNDRMHDGDGDVVLFVVGFFAMPYVVGTIIAMGWIIAVLIWRKLSGRWHS